FSISINGSDIPRFSHNAGSSDRSVRMRTRAPLRRLRVAAKRRLLLPMTLYDPYRSHFHAHRIAAKFRHDRKLIDLGRGADVVIVAELPQVGPSLADFEGAQQHASVRFVTVPRQARGVVEAHFPGIA